MAAEAAGGYTSPEKHRWREKILFSRPSRDVRSTGFRFWLFWILWGGKVARARSLTILLKEWSSIWCRGCICCVMRLCERSYGEALWQPIVRCVQPTALCCIPCLYVHLRLAHDLWETVAPNFATLAVARSKVHEKTYHISLLAIRTHFLRNKTTRGRHNLLWNTGTSFDPLRCLSPETLAIFMPKGVSASEELSPKPLTFHGQVILNLQIRHPFLVCSGHIGVLAVLPQHRVRFLSGRVADLTMVRR